MITAKEMRHGQRYNTGDMALIKSRLKMLAGQTPKPSNRFTKYTIPNRKLGQIHIKYLEKHGFKVKCHFYRRRKYKYTSKNRVHARTGQRYRSYGKKPVGWTKYYEYTISW